MKDRGQRSQVERVVDALEAGADGAVDHDSVTAAVEADFRRYSAVRIKDFVPLFVERDVRARLHDNVRS